LSRRTLTDAQWARIEGLLPGKIGDRGRSGTDNRLFVDAVLWLARGASPWRDLPPELGHWKTVYTRFRRWSRAGVWENLFSALRQDPDFEYVLVDATISKVHADATSQKGGLKLSPSAVREAA
jgi:putative transposase